MIELAPNQRCNGHAGRSCEWVFEIEDSSLPSWFGVDVFYAVDADNVVVTGLNPTWVWCKVDATNARYTHEFRECEKPGIWLWVLERLKKFGGIHLPEIEAAIEQDRQSLSEQTDETFRNLVGEVH